MHDLWRQLPHEVFIYLYVYDGNVVLKAQKFQAEDKGNFPFPSCFSGSCPGRTCSRTRTQSCEIQLQKAALVADTPKITTPRDNTHYLLLLYEVSMVRDDP